MRMGYKDGTSLSVMTGVSAGVTEAFIVASFELVKIRLQNKANVCFVFTAGLLIRRPESTRIPWTVFKRSSGKKVRPLLV